MAKPALLVALFASLAGCSTPTDRLQYDNPSLTPLSLSFDTVPPPFADGVARDATLRVTLDDFPDPDAATFGPVLLRSGVDNFDADIRVDLVGQAILVKPRALLQPGTQYELVISSAIRALDGRTPSATQIFPFTTGTMTTPPSTPAPKLTWADVAPILAASAPAPGSCFSAQNPPAQLGCAPYCHSPCGASGRMRTPTRGLDLTGDPRDPSFGLINVPSVGLAGTTKELPRVLPGDSARSELLRKLLGGGIPPVQGDAPYPDTAVDGKRMPIDLNSELALPPLDPSALRLIQQWIDDGALVD